MKILRGVHAALIALLLATGSAIADERDHRHGGERGRHQGWHGDIHRFHEHDLGRWRAGRWHQGHYLGRYGWWWVVGGLWYYYPAPIYPYPDPYLPPMAAASASPPTSQFWYYCPNPPGYYPYIAQCARNWQPVPAGSQPGMPRY